MKFNKAFQKFMDSRMEQIKLKESNLTYEIIEEIGIDLKKDLSIEQVARLFKNRNTILESANLKEAYKLGFNDAIRIVLNALNEEL